VDSYIVSFFAGIATGEIEVPGGDRDTARLDAVRLTGAATLRPPSPRRQGLRKNQ
jgi:hypothetical protein